MRAGAPEAISCLRRRPESGGRKPFPGQRAIGYGPRPRSGPWREGRVALSALWFQGQRAPGYSPWPRSGPKVAGEVGDSHGHLAGQGTRARPRMGARLVARGVSPWYAGAITLEWNAALKRAEVPCGGVMEKIVHDVGLSGS